MAVPPPLPPFAMLKDAYFTPPKWKPFFALLPHRTISGKWIWLTKAFTKIEYDYDLTLHDEHVYTTYEEGLLEVLSGN